MSQIRESLQIHNSMTRKKSLFKPINPPEVMMYTCGITVYDFCHMGHAKAMVSFDTIARYLRAVGYKVTFVRNITDIDDKIIKRAIENEEPFTELTERFISAMNEDCAALNIATPDLEPRATQFIAQIIAMVETLIDKGFAYAAPNGDVYYEVATFKPYGKLSHKQLDELQVGARVEVGEAKRSPLDFVLWKAAKPGEPSWPSPWGEGRPGWHIECSAMATSTLANTIDIHGGGADLLFPHHENEVAQSEAATDACFANYWLHNGFVQINDEKMSKSLGNFFAIRDVLQHYKGEVLRYFIVASHYRSPLNYSEALLQAAEESVNRFYQALRTIDGLAEVKQRPWSLLTELSEAPAGVGDSVAAQLAACRQQFLAAMDDDFNSPKAIAVLHELVSILNRLDTKDQEARQSVARDLLGLGEILGLLQMDPESYFQGGQTNAEEVSEIEALITARNDARAAKDWAKADQIRDQLKAMGVALEDKAGKTIWRKESGTDIKG